MICPKCGEKVYLDKSAFKPGYISYVTHEHWKGEGKWENDQHLKLTYFDLEGCYLTMKEWLQMKSSEEKR